MRLNEAKTVVLPFRPWSETSEPLRLDLKQLGVDVVGTCGRTKLLGIYYGPLFCPTARLQHLLADMKTRCYLWSHRALILRGQVAILQQIILPILWYRPVSVTFPRLVFKIKSPASYRALSARISIKLLYLMTGGFFPLDKAA